MTAPSPERGTNETPIRRVLALCDRWDALSKGESMTTRAIRAEIEKGEKMSLPSAALRSLQSAAKRKMLPANKPVTWGDLLSIYEEALKEREADEHDEYMGDDQ